MRVTRRSSILAVGILLMGLCLGVTGAWAQFTVDVTIDAVTLDQFGVVTVSGTVTCSETSQFCRGSILRCGSLLGRRTHW